MILNEEALVYLGWLWEMQAINATCQGKGDQPPQPPTPTRRRL